MEVEAVYLWKDPDVSCASFLERLRKEHLPAVDAIGSNKEVVLKIHKEKLLSRLLAPTLDLLLPEKSLMLEYAALLPPDVIALPWLKELTAQTHPELLQTPPEYAGWISVESRHLSNLSTIS